MVHMRSSLIIRYVLGLVADKGIMNEDQTTVYMFQGFIELAAAAISTFSEFSSFKEVAWNDRLDLQISRSIALSPLMEIPDLSLS
jgi:hypothetical protein